MQQENGCIILLFMKRRKLMASTIKRTNPGDAANIFVRCMLSDLSDMLGGCSKEDIDKTIKYFDYKCPFTGDDIRELYYSDNWVLDHLIPHNRTDLGLNIYGNLIVTTKETNAKKSKKDFETFIMNDTDGTEEEKYLRIQKLKKFQHDSGYFEKVKNLDKIKDVFQQEDDAIQNRLVDLQKLYSQELHIPLTKINTIGSRRNQITSIKSDDKIQNEIQKVHSKIPRWFLNPKQINSRILLCFLFLQENDGEVTYTELARKAKTALKVKNFKNNFTQMANISPNNHAKVFEQKGDKIYLWAPVKEFILDYYTKIKQQIDTR